MEPLHDLLNDDGAGLGLNLARLHADKTHMSSLRISTCGSQSSRLHHTNMRGSWLRLILGPAATHSRSDARKGVQGEKYEQATSYGSSDEEADEGPSLRRYDYRQNNAEDDCGGRRNEANDASLVVVNDEDERQPHRQEPGAEPVQQSQGYMPTRTTRRLE